MKSGRSTDYIGDNIIFNKKNSDQKNFIEDTPRRLVDYIGQEDLICRLNIYLGSAKKRESAADHMLFFGPPGLGKTTLAEVIACELNNGFKVTSGPLLQKTSDIVSILNNIRFGEVLFIDEIHRLSISCAEILYTAMEQFKIDILIGNGNAAKIVTITLPRFTLIGATTKLGTLPNPLRSRFGIIEKFDWYSLDALKVIVTKFLDYFGIIINSDAALKIAAASRGTPRIAKKIAAKIRDYGLMNNINNITEDLVCIVLDFFNILPNGLTEVDIAILKLLYEKNRPLGVDAIRTILNEEKETIEEVYEPFLLRLGYIERTARGRILSKEYIDDILKIIYHDR